MAAVACQAAQSYANGIPGLQVSVTPHWQALGCECRFITCSVITFATVIAITKDLPDVEGDRKYGIETFSTRLGTRAVAFLGKPACYLKWSAHVVLLREGLHDGVKICERPDTHAC